MSEQGREQAQRVEYQLHADRERRAEPARDTMRCSRCRQYVPIVTHLCPAELDHLRAEHRRLLRQSNEARHIARYLWRLDGVREQWTPPEKYGLDWLTRELPSEDDQGREQAACDCPGCMGGPVPHDCPPTCAGCLSGQHGMWRRHQRGREQTELERLQSALLNTAAALADRTAERDEARDAAEHLWFHNEEHGVSHEEARRWYPWLYELHEQKQASRRREQS